MIPSLEAAIQTQLLLDNSGAGNLNGIVGTRITNIQGSRATLTYPYIVYQITSAAEDVDSFTRDGITAHVDVHILDQVESGIANCLAIMQRVRGDAVLQTDRVPTYGLHRWLVGTLSGGWIGGQMVRVDGSAQHELNILHYVETYRVTASFGT